MSGKIPKPRGKVKFEDFYRICVNAVKTVGINLMPNEDWTSTHIDLVNRFMRNYYKFWILNGIWTLISYSVIFCSLFGDWLSFEFLKSVIALLTGICNIYKGFLMNQHEHEIKDILAELKKYFPIYAWDQKKYGIQQELKKLIRLKKIYLTLNILLLIGIFVPELIFFTLKGKITFGNWTPVDISSVLSYTLNYIWFVWISFTFCLCGFGADFVLYSTVTMISIQFKVIFVLNRLNFPAQTI